MTYDDVNALQRAQYRINTKLTIEISRKYSRGMTDFAFTLGPWMYEALMLYYAYGRDSPPLSDELRALIGTLNSGNGLTVFKMLIAKREHNETSNANFQADGQGRDLLDNPPTCVTTSV